MSNINKGSATGSQIDLVKLEELARAATRGPWKRAERLNGPFWHISSEHTIGGEPCKSGRQAIAAVHGESKRGATAYAAMFEANANFIAAANPAAVLELIALARVGQQAGYAAGAQLSAARAAGMEEAAILAVKVTAIPRDVLGPATVNMKTRAAIGENLASMIRVHATQAAQADHNSQDPACSCPSGSGSLTWPCPVHAAPARAAREKEDQWIFDLAAKHELPTRNIWGPVMFSATGIVAFVHAIKTLEDAKEAHRNIVISHENSSRGSQP